MCVPLTRCVVEPLRPTAGVSTRKPGVDGGWPGVMMCVQLTRCRRAFEADGGRIYHEAWCGWGVAWGDDVRAADPLSESL